MSQRPVRNPQSAPHPYRRNLLSSSCPPLRLLLPNLPEEQPCNYTLCLYNKCSHIHDFISASSGPVRGQVELSVLVVQAGKLRLREEQRPVPGCETGGNSRESGSASSTRSPGAGNRTVRPERGVRSTIRKREVMGGQRGQVTLKPWEFTCRGEGGARSQRVCLVGLETEARGRQDLGASTEPH